MKYLFVVLALLVSACTYPVKMIDTAHNTIYHGEARDNGTGKGDLYVIINGNGYSGEWYEISEALYTQETTNTWGKKSSDNTTQQSYGSVTSNTSRVKAYLKGPDRIITCYITWDSSNMQGVGECDDKGLQYDIYVN